MSTHDSASRKHSRMWNSGYPSRSGYREHASQHDENGIQLSNHDAKYQNVNIVSGGQSSPTSSTVGLNKELELDKGRWAENIGGAGHAGIIKTVKITQL